jgi:CelD/BcsL family acetyltransferase involved in cellulose biosynthesis
MSRLELQTFSTVAELRAAAVAWDDLWQRSEVALPTARAELLAQWLEQFAPAQPWRALAVCDGDRLLAAILLVQRSVRGLLKLGQLATNEWCTAGDLLVDPAADDRAIDRLVAEVGRLRWPLMWLEPIAVEESRWQRFLAAAERAGMTSLRQPCYMVGQIDLGGPWSEYEASWSGNHRRQMRKVSKRALRDGELHLSILDRLHPDEVEAWLRCGFEIEDRSWKGAAGSSVLRTPGMFNYFLAQARVAAGWGQLQLVFLEHQGRPIAFEYGFRAKGTYFTPKVGYDEQFAAYSPGQLLRLELLARLHEEGQVERVDFCGPLADATAKWANHSYPLARVLLAPRRVSSWALLQGYRLARAGLSRLRQARGHVSATPAAPAASEQAAENAAELVDAGRV